MDDRKDSPNIVRDVGEQKTFEEKCGHRWEKGNRETNMMTFVCDLPYGHSGRHTSATGEKR